MAIASALISGASTLIGGGLSLWGSHQASQDAAHAQELANESNERIAKENRAFQERMSSSAYQRATVDMRKANINPLEAYSQGGASTPAGSTATMRSTQTDASRLKAAGYQHMANSIANAGNLLDMKLKQAQIDNVKAQTDKVKADTGFTIGPKTDFTRAQSEFVRSGVGLNHVSSALKRMNIKQSVQDVIHRKLQNKKVRAELVSVQNASQLRKTTVGRLLQQGGIAAHDVASVVSSIKSIFLK